MKFFCGIAAVLLAARTILVAEETPSVAALAKDLASPDLAVRRGAATHLSELGRAARPALPELIRALGDPDRQVWSAAVAAMAALGPDAADAVPKLIEGLTSRRSGRAAAQVVFRSANALARIGPAAVPGLIEVLRNEDTVPRSAAARALGGIGPAAKDAIPGLIANFRYDLADERHEIAEALGGIGPAALDPLAKALDSAQPPVRAGAALALAQLGPVAHSLAPRVAQIAARERDPGVRSALFPAIAKLEVEPARATEILLAGVKDEDPAVRHAATNAIYVYRAAAGPLVAALAATLSDPNPVLSDRAANALGRLGQAASPAVEALLAASQAHTPTSPAVADALGRIGPAAVPGIFRAVAKLDADSITRDHWSVRCLVVIGGEAVPQMSAALHDERVSVRLAAARGLGELGPVAAPAFAALSSATADADPRVRATALAALVSTRAQTLAVLSKVDEGLRDAAPLVRVAAAQLVLFLGERARPLAPTLLEMLQNPDAAVRAAAVDALTAIGGGEVKPALPRLLEMLPGADAGMRVRLLRLLANIGPDAQDALPEVSRELRDENGAVRAAALRAFARIEDHGQRLQVMLAALEDADLAVRRTAEDELGAMGASAQQAAPWLAAALQREKERDVVFDALQKIEVRSVPALISMLRDRDIAVKSFACQRLGSLGAEGRDAGPALKELIARPDEREEVRAAARSALQKLEPAS